MADRLNNRIQKFQLKSPCPSGTSQIRPDVCFVTKWGSLGSAAGQFHFPDGIAVAPDGSVFVADTFNNRIEKFHVISIGSSCPKGTTSIGSGVCFTTTWGSYGKGDGQFIAPFGVAVDPSGNVFVTDNQNHRIQKFTGTGTFLDKWGCLFWSPC